MAGKTVQRRLAAILAADVVGYSQLMSIDEVRTLDALKAHRRELLDPAIAAHHGRIVKTTGDGALVEFASVVDAVGCAVLMQRSMVSRNASVAEDRRIVFRMGINVGDIIIDGDDIFGDGVNIAARLEALCEPGGICISRAANDQIRDKLWPLTILSAFLARAREGHPSASGFDPAAPAPSYGDCSARGDRNRWPRGVAVNHPFRVSRARARGPPIGQRFRSGGAGAELWGLFGARRSKPLAEGWLWRVCALAFHAG